jgi:tRNA-specific adenosine deaminase 3
VLRDVVPSEVTNSLQHLRRFAKPEFLPRHLSSASDSSDVFDVSGTPENQPCSSTREAKSTTSHLLVCPTSTVSISALERLFEDHIQLFHPLALDIRLIDVPLFAPTSATQASEWSANYWPTIYKNTNPYGPHPSLVRRAELELLANGDADRYMALAMCVAKKTTCTNFDIETGAVIVERAESTKKTRIVAVAQDGRDNSIGASASPADNCRSLQQCTDNVMGHATLRAIAMVAQKRRALVQLPHSASIRDENNISREQEAERLDSSPLNDTEKQYLTAIDNLLPNGYLCLDLEIYLTHEPCVMCSMAILHSRFSRVVFTQRMMKTGALSAEESSLGHGLGWRDQLNWKFLAWQWRPLTEVDDGNGLCEGDFHA